MFEQVLTRKMVRESLSEQIAQQTSIDDLEKKIQKMTYDFPTHNDRLGKILDDIRGVYRYYFDPAINTNKRAYTKMRYAELKKEHNTPSLAMAIAKATPVDVNNATLKSTLALGFAATTGRNLSEEHFKYIAKKSGIPEKKLINLSFLTEPLMHSVTAAQVFPQVYAVTKGASETMKWLFGTDIDITPEYSQVLIGLFSMSALQYAYHRMTGKYVRAYHAATSLPFGGPVFWMSTAHSRYLRYKDKVKESENQHIYETHEEHADRTSQERLSYDQDRVSDRRRISSS